MILYRKWVGDVLFISHSILLISYSDKALPDEKEGPV